MITEIGGAAVGTALAIDTCGDDASGIACSLATGEKTTQTDVHEGVGGAEDAYGRGGAGFNGNDNCLISKETTALGPKELEALAQAARHMVGHPEMQGRGDETGGIGRAWKVVAEFAVDEIRHALRRGSLPHVALLPAVGLQPLLIIHHLERSVALDILWTQFDHHSTVGPLPATITRTHAVDHYLAVGSSCGDNKTARTHTEGIDATLIDLGDEGIFGCGEILPPALLVVILYAVDEFGGVLKSHSNRQPLCLDLDAAPGKIAINIARTMTCGKDDGPTERELLAALNTLSLNAHNGVALKGHGDSQVPCPLRGKGI